MGPAVHAKDKSPAGCAVIGNMHALAKAREKFMASSRKAACTVADGYV